MNKRALSLFASFLNFGAERAYQKDPKPENRRIIENIPYIDDGDEKHLMDIIYPDCKQELEKNKGHVLYPFILNIHGGGFGMNSKDKIYRNYAVRLAGDQFAVVNINFRLSGDAAFPAQIEDVLSVIRFVNEHAALYELDRNNMFLSGDSSGAYMATMAACVVYSEKLRAQYHFSEDISVRAIAANCGMYDFTTYLGSDVKFPMKKQIAQELFHDSNYEALPVYPLSSVFSYINESYPPVYIMDTDKMSFAAEASRLAVCLKKWNVPYQIHIFDRKENLMHAFHIMAKYKQSNVVLDEIFKFFAHYIKKD